MRVRDVMGPGRILSRASIWESPSHRGTYEERPGQLTMAEAVEDALAEERPLFVEAGTGTGKTLAYLLPAVLSGKKVVISTATRALQEQIFVKDLPLVAEVLGAHGIRFRSAMMKGLSNYLCKRRFAELRSSEEGARLGYDADLLAIEDWAKETETGDRAELVKLPEDADAWRRVSSSTETRIGAECKYFRECFVTAMRREAEQAEIIVVNHHLFCADLALRKGRGEGDYGSVIPAYDAVVFDEAHQLEDVATNFFGVRASTARIEALTRDARRSFVKATAEAKVLLELVDEASKLFFEALARSASARSSAPSGGGVRGRDVPAGLERVSDRRSLDRDAFSGTALDRYAKLDACLEALAGHADAHAIDESIALVARRTRDLRKDLDRIVRGAEAASLRAEEDEHSQDIPRRLDNVAWLEMRERSVVIGASPVDLAPTLRAALFNRVPTVICTSATLATSAKPERAFEFAKARLGAPADAREMVVASPFDFATRSALYLPSDLPEPSDPAYDRACADRIAELVEITGGGAFVLCTSNRAMRSLHASIVRLVGARHEVLLQGDAPKHLLLSKFRANNDAILVATMSFWEGVDVPGDALRLVILDKIPFAVPTDPVVSARSAELEREGRNAFSEYTLPTAALTLKQGFGRLLRTEKDAGIVAILDRRLTTKGYGKALLASLPPARRVTSLDQLRAFWLEIRS
jgi:ATP-dependent DNA helicase DinG